MPVVALPFEEDVEICALVKASDPARHDVRPSRVAIVHALALVEDAERLVVIDHVLLHRLVIEIAVSMEDGLDWKSGFDPCRMLRIGIADAEAGHCKDVVREFKDVNVNRSFLLDGVLAACRTFEVTPNGHP